MSCGVRNNVNPSRDRLQVVRLDVEGSAYVWHADEGWYEMQFVVYITQMGLYIDVVRVQRLIASTIPTYVQ